MSGAELLKKDIKNVFPALLAAFLACIVLTFLFGTCCPMRILTGLPCPACGTTRSVLALLRLDFGKALWYQPVMPLLIAFLVFFFYRRYYKMQTDTALFMRILGVIFIISILAYIYRMYKYYPVKPPLEYTPNNFIQFIRGIIKNVRKL